MGIQIVSFVGSAGETPERRKSLQYKGFCIPLWGKLLLLQAFLIRIIKELTEALYQCFGQCLVEARRIELLSEDKFTWLSPSASVDLDFLTAPRGGALCGSVAF